MAEKQRKKVVIIGAGFAGLWAARALSGAAVDVLLVDRNNYHTFLPLLYQVAAAELEPEGIAQPARHLLRGHSNLRFALAEVRGIDFDRRAVKTDGPPLGYDYLILATGSVSYFFGVPGAAEHCFELKSLEQGVGLRSHIMASFEKAAREEDGEARRRLLSFTIVGGGATGVEYAGALAELIQGPLRKDYPELEFGEVKVTLLEGGENLLPALPAKLGAYALERLKRMGIEARLGAKVEEVTGETVLLHGGEILETSTVVWTAGVRGDPLAGEMGLPISSGGQVVVLPSLQVADRPEIYVAGDLARVEDGLPMIAPVAMQQGRLAAENILRRIASKEPISFGYSDRGSMVTIGRNAAVASVGEWNFTGFFAWLLWLGIHFVKLIGFRNRLLVLVNWAWDYLFFERAARLILPARKKPPRGRKGGL